MIYEKIRKPKINLSDKLLDDMNHNDLVNLLTHKWIIYFNGNRKVIREIRTMHKYLDECLWHRMASQEMSSTFNQVCYTDQDHKLWKCAFDCDGYQTMCKGYRGKRNLKKLN